MRAVNLIPAEQRERRTGYANRSNGVAYVLLGVVALLALMALLYGKSSHEVSSKEAEATRYEAEAQKVQANATSLAPYKTFIAMREGREKAVRELVDTRFDWAHAVAEFGQVMPSGASVTSLEGCVQETSATTSSEGGCQAGGSGSNPKSKGTFASATPAGSVPRFTLAGCATTQSVIARMLSNLRLIDGVASAELTSATKGGTGGGGGGGAAGQCEGALVSYGIKVNFQPLPTPPAGSAGHSAVPASSSSGGSGKPTGAPE